MQLRSRQFSGESGASFVRRYRMVPKVDRVEFRRNVGSSRSKAAQRGLGDREVGPASVHDFPRCGLAGSSAR